MIPWNGGELVATKGRGALAPGYEPEELLAKWRKGREALARRLLEHCRGGGNPPDEWSINLLTDALEREQVFCKGMER